MGGKERRLQLVVARVCRSGEDVGDASSRSLRKDSGDESEFVMLSICPSWNWASITPNQAAGLALQKSGSL